MDGFRSGRYLTFRVGRQEFAIEADPVKAILPAHELVGAEHPDPEWLAGECHLRGEAFPVIDLRLRLRLRPGISGRTPSIVVVEACTARTPACRVETRLDACLKCPDCARGIDTSVDTARTSACGTLIGFLADCVSEIIHARAHDYRNGKIRIGRPRQVVPLSELTL